MREFSFRSLEIASLAQEVVKRRMERALYCERELDSMMNALVRCAELCEDKAEAKSILSRFDALKIEDLSKVMNVLKSCSLRDEADTEADTEDGKFKFEDLYG